MPWFNVDDGFSDHPKVLLLQSLDGWEGALSLWTLAGAWSAKHLTEGSVPRYVVTKLGATERSAELLVSVGLWTKTCDKYQFKNWLKRNPAKSSVEQKRKENADRQAAFREKKKAERNAVTSALRNAPVTAPTPLLSSPLLSSPEEGEDTRSERDVVIDRTIKKILSEPPPRFATPPPPPANEAAERRSHPRADGEPSGGHLQEFELVLGSACFQRDTDAPVLGRAQCAAIVKRVMGYAARKRLSFPEACDAMVTRAFDDVEATGKALALALGSAEPDKPAIARQGRQQEREVSPATQRAIEDGQRRRARGEFF